MKNLNKLALCAMTLGLAACSQQDEPIQGTVDGTVDGLKDVYASLTIKLPTDGGRADEKDQYGDPYNNGYEYGQDDENNVGKVLVVLATKNGNAYEFLTAATADAKLNDPNYGTNGNEVKYILNFASADMVPNKPLDKEPSESNQVAERHVYVFAYCNPTAALVTYFREGNINAGETFASETGKILNKDLDEIWTPNQFLMTNCELAEVDIPKREDLVQDHNTVDKAYDLGTVRVKRVAARFDFATTVYKDENFANEENEANVYPVYDLDGKTLMGKVELTKMAAFNIAKSYYYIPRSSKNWNWSSPTLCGSLEDFVVSPGQSYKSSNSSLSDYDLNNYYFCSIVGNDLNETVTEGEPVSDADLTWVSLKDWNDKKVDNDEGWTPVDKKDYRIWRYVSENTIPATLSGSTESQKIGVTTGVAFKGEFLPDNQERWNGNAIYVHGDVAYGDYDALYKYVRENPTTLVAQDFELLVKAQKIDTLNVRASKESLIAGLGEKARYGFVCYEPCADNKVGEPSKYKMYYFYYNRHKTNGNPSLMGENEFGVVRNNVYKLAVTTCNRLGKPEPSDDPDDPDEKENAYFTVSCLVMPWTVRVNDIEF